MTVNVLSRAFIRSFKGLFALIFALCIFYPAASKEATQGTILTDSLFSNSLGKYKKLRVYLPPDYNQNGTLRYRTIYLLHGATGSYDYYSSFYTTFDSLIANHIIQPSIIIMPDGSEEPYAGSFYTNSALYGKYEDYIYIDLITYADANYKTLATRNDRAIAGHSMGGFGAMNIAFKHSDLFRTAASMSGPLDLYNFTSLVTYIKLENGFLPPFNFNPANGIVTMLGFSLAGALSPNIERSPYYVDFLLNSNGQIVDSVFKKWKANAPSRFSKNINAQTNLALYFDCGIQDELTLLSWNNAFRDTLALRNIPFQYKTYTGNHTNKLGERIPVALKFLDSAMNRPTNILQGTGTPNNFILNQNEPNPFNPNTTISFLLPVGTFAKLKVYDIMGREVANLINTNLSAGGHQINFNGSSLSTGIYFYRLETENFSETKKMMLLK
jgi:S-formylglutathione hydrolase FrmB